MVTGHAEKPSPALSPHPLPHLCDNRLPCYLCVLTGSYGMSVPPCRGLGSEGAAFSSLLQVAVKLSGWRWRGRQALRLYPRTGRTQWWTQCWHCWRNWKKGECPGGGCLPTCPAPLPR